MLFKNNRENPEAPLDEAPIPQDTVPQDVVSPADEAPFEETGRWVKVAVMGGDEVTLSFCEDMTVGDALREAEVEVGRRHALFVNGEPASKGDVLEPNSTVQVTGKISNG